LRATTLAWRALVATEKNVALIMAHGCQVSGIRNQVSGCRGGILPPAITTPSALRQSFRASTPPQEGKGIRDQILEHILRFSPARASGQKK
jgi:hypothetical protein